MHRVPVFQIVFARSLFMIVACSVGCFYTNTSPLGHRCGAEHRRTVLGTTARCRHQVAGAHCSHAWC
jgi:hypothetical protein